MSIGGEETVTPKDKDQSTRTSKGKYKDVDCHYCHKKGHIKKYCWKFKNKSENDNNEKGKDNSDDKDTINATSVDFLLVHEFESMNLIDNSINWVIDRVLLFVSHVGEIFLVLTLMVILAV